MNGRKETMIEMCGVNLTESDNKDISTLIEECKGDASKLFPEDSFAKIFFEQLKYNELRVNRSMRWHPVIIRLCLYIKNRSSKAYEGIREFSPLPSTRTLYDYTHYIDSALVSSLK